MSDETYQAPGCRNTQLQFSLEVHEAAHAQGKDSRAGEPSSKLGFTTKPL